jgi:hypothetical protein
MEIAEVIRRWQAGESGRSIARASGLARNTVDKYLRLAAAAGISQGGEPPGEELLRRSAARERRGTAAGGAQGPPPADRELAQG